MLNVLKSDLYRMVRMKSFYVMMIILFLFNIIQALIYDGESFIYFLSSISGNIPLLIGIFMAIFVSSDYKHGYIKNIAGIVPSKVYLIASKFIIVAIYLVILFAVYIFSGMLLSVIFADEGFIYDSIKATELLSFLGVHFVMDFAMALIPIALAAVTRSNALSCVFTVLITTGFISGIAMTGYMLLTMLEIIPESFKFHEYFLSMRLVSTSYNTESSEMLITLGISAAYMVVAIAVAIYAVKKKDVR